MMATLMPYSTRWKSIQEQNHQKLQQRQKILHCVKCVNIRSYSGLHFPAFGLNTERYGVSLRIQSKCGKMGTKITPNTDILSQCYFLKCFHTFIRNTSMKLKCCLHIVKMLFCGVCQISKKQLFTGVSEKLFQNILSSPEDFLMRHSFAVAFSFFQSFSDQIFCRTPAGACFFFE